VISAHGLYVRFRHLIHEVAKFGVIGGIAFVVTEVGTNVLHFDTGLGPLTSNVIASAIATVVSYVGNRYWTFRHREGSGIGREYVVFFVLNAIGILIQLAAIGFTYYALGLHGKLSYNVALIFGITLGTLFRFWSYRKFVWRAQQAAPPADHEALEPAGTVAATPPAPGQADAGRVDEPGRIR
jgi:putative flippase GtrA